jgi:hypothetical protein
MLLLELAALAFVGLYVLYRAIHEARPRTFLLRLLLISIACWMSEESSIRLYHFYSYSPTWGLFLGRVPVLIILIWPVIIHSAWDLASQLLHSKRKFIPLAAAAIVCTDASLIEPVAVNAGLWSWTQPGIFDVPPIGILGWAYFAFLCVLLLETGREEVGSKRYALLILVCPLIATHLLLIATWWVALRWINIPMNPAAVAGVAWAISFMLVCRILKRRTGMRVKKKALLLRLLAALFVFALLALNAGGSGLLVLYVVAFAPPYLMLMAQQYRV